MEPVAFDMYGTLCDPQSVTQRLSSFVQDPEAIGQVWRQKQLEYSFLVSMMGRYEDFWHVTRRALDYALDRAGITLKETAIDYVMEGYCHLQLFPDALEGLRLLREAHCPMVILSNGSLSMLRDLAENSGVVPYFDTILSADAVQVFKPAPQVYQQAANHFKRPLNQIWMVSSNSFDAVGAKTAGMRVGWINRQGVVLDKVGGQPDIITENLVAFAQTLLERMKR